MLRRAGLDGTLTAAFVRDAFHLAEDEADALLRALFGSRFFRHESDGSPSFPARVEKAFVFGSYFSTTDRLGDVDVAIHLVPREPAPDKHRAANAQRVGEEAPERAASQVIP